MSNRFDTHRDVINAWPTLVAFSEDIDVPYETAKGMKSRDSIDGRYWSAVVSAASRRGIEGVSLQVLADIAAGKRPVRAEAS